MNVVIYAHYQPPAPSASATRMLSLARHLRSLGHQVTFLTSMAGPAEVEGFPVARVAGRLGLTRWLRNTPPCPIFVSSPPATPAAEVAWAARALGYQVMVDIRDPSVIEAIKQQEFKPGLATRVKGWLEQSLPRAGLVVSFVSETLRDEFAGFANFTPQRTVIAPNGVDLSIFQWGPSSFAEGRRLLGLGDEPLFAYQGILGGKELDKVVAALGPALSGGARLLIVGIVDTHSLPIKEALHDQLRAKGLLDQLIWRENLSLPQMAQLLPAVDIGVNPLPLDRSYCLPVKTYEYMAAGCYNLAHGAATGALKQQLPEHAGEVATSWVDYCMRAQELAADVVQLRQGQVERVRAAKQFSRQTANERIAEVLLKLTTQKGA